MHHNFSTTVSTTSFGHFPMHTSITSFEFSFNTSVMIGSDSSSLNISLRRCCVPGHCITIRYGSSIEYRSHREHVLLPRGKLLRRTSSHFNKLVWVIIFAKFSQILIISGNLFDIDHQIRYLGPEHTRISISNSL